MRRERIVCESFFLLCHRSTVYMRIVQHIMHSRGAFGLSPARLYVCLLWFAWTWWIFQVYRSDKKSKLSHSVVFDPSTYQAIDTTLLRISSVAVANSSIRFMLSTFQFHIHDVINIIWNYSKSIFLVVFIYSYVNSVSTSKICFEMDLRDIYVNGSLFSDFFCKNRFFKKGLA